MASQINKCMGSYDFNHIAFYARQRFIEGRNTVELMQEAGSLREKEEIALVSLLHVDNAEIEDIQLTCKYSISCKITDCRDRLISLLEAEIGDFIH